MYIKPNLLSVKCTLYCTVHRNETKSEKEWFKNTIWNGFQIVYTVQYISIVFLQLDRKKLGTLQYRMNQYWVNVNGGTKGSFPTIGLKISL